MKKIALIVLSAALILFLVFSILIASWGTPNQWFSAGSTDAETTDAGTSWFLYAIGWSALFISLAVAAYGAYKNGTGIGSQIFLWVFGALLLMSALAFLALGQKGFVREVADLQETANDFMENGFNSGESHESPESFEPKRYTDGMKLHLSIPGEKRLILLAGQITVLSFESGHCIRFVPVSAVDWTSNEENTEVLVQPKHGVEKLITVRLRRPGEETCQG